MTHRGFNNKNYMYLKYVDRIHQIYQSYHYPLLLALYFSMATLAYAGGIGECFLNYIANYPYPEVIPRSSVAYPNIYLNGTSAVKTNKSPFVYVLVTKPFLLANPPIAYEEACLGTVT